MDSPASLHPTLCVALRRAGFSPLNLFYSFNRPRNLTGAWPLARLNVLYLRAPERAETTFRSGQYGASHAAIESCTTPRCLRGAPEGRGDLFWGRSLPLLRTNRSGIFPKGGR
jgi:hypothetical protein